MFLHWHTCSHRNKDTENDASEAGWYGHPWVTLASDGDVRKTVWKTEEIWSTNLCLHVFCKKKKNRISLWSITSYAVAPGQQSQTQHGVAETEHHTEHVQKTDHFRGWSTLHSPRSPKEQTAGGRKRHATEEISSPQHQFNSTLTPSGNNNVLRAVMNSCSMPCSFSHAGLKVSN